MKYKYRLVENEEPTTPDDGGEENGLKKMQFPQELKLTTHRNVKVDDIVDILENPKYFSTIFIGKSNNLLDLEKKVFGDKPTSEKFITINQKIYNENGNKLYKEIVDSVGNFEVDGDGKTKTIKQKDKITGKTLFMFPINSAKNQKLISNYLKIKPKINIKFKKIDNFTLTFPMSSKSDVEKILNNAKEANVISSKDYSLETIDKLDENKLRESIKEILKKIK